MHMFLISYNMEQIYKETLESQLVAQHVPTFNPVAVANKMAIPEEIANKVAKISRYSNSQQATAFLVEALVNIGNSAFYNLVDTLRCIGNNQVADQLAKKLIENIGSSPEALLEELTRLKTVQCNAHNAFKEAASRIMDLQALVEMANAESMSESEPEEN